MLAGSSSPGAAGEMGGQAGDHEHSCRRPTWGGPSAELATHVCTPAPEGAREEESPKVPLKPSDSEEHADTPSVGTPQTPCREGVPRWWRRTQPQKRG